MVLLFTALTSAIFLLPPHLKDLGRSLISQPLLLSNVYFWRVVQAGYFGDPPEIRPLLHTWSLGVEEQFYLFYPLLLVLILKRDKLAPHLAKILGGIVLLSLALSALLTPIKSVLSFFTLPTRAWELLLGGLLALKPAASPDEQQTCSRAPRELASVLGLGLVAYATFFFNHQTPFPGYAALLPCLGTALIIWSNSTTNQTFLGRLLSRPPVVLIGQVSYSLYLWHWPLIAYGDYFFLLKSTEAKLAAVLISCWLGYASWRWIETPFRKKRYLATRRAVFTMFVLYALVCLGLGLCCQVLALKGERSSLYIPAPTRSRIYEYRFKNKPTTMPQLGKTFSSPQFILWGDSHAMSLAPLLDLLGREFGVGGLQLTRSASAPLIHWDYKDPKHEPKSEGVEEQWADLALNTATSRKLKVIFLVGYWQIYSRPSLPQELIKTIEEFNKRGVKVVLVADNPTLPNNPWRQANLSIKWDFVEAPTIDSKIQQEHKERNLLVSKAITNLPPQAQVKVIDLSPTVLGWESLLSERSKILYLDDDHLSGDGALEMRPLFVPVFEEMARGK